MAVSLRQLAPLIAVSVLTVSMAQSPAERPIVPVIGAVKIVSGNRVLVDTGNKTVTVTADRSTEVWKGKTFHDLSPVEPGDDFWARCRAGASDQLVAEEMWLNIVNLFGVITSVDRSGSAFEMRTNPNADPASAYVKKHLKVAMDGETSFNVSAREDLRAGREVQLVGLGLKDGTVRATKVTVYEGKRPVRLANHP